jgi:chitinase
MKKMNKGKRYFSLFLERIAMKNKSIICSLIIMMCLFVLTSCQKKVSILFDAQGGNIDQTSITCKKNDEFNEFATPEKSGFAFDGWYTSDSFEESEKVSFPYVVKESTTFYAHWLQTSFRVAYVLNDGVFPNGEEAIQMVSSSSYTLLIPTRTGYVFDGWYLDASCANKASSIVDIKEDTTFYAKWNQVFLVQYELNGGTVSEGALPTEIASPIESLTEVEKANYEFAGWYTSATFEENTKVSFPYLPKENVILYAKWEQSRFQISYFLKDGWFSDDVNPVASVGKEEFSLVSPVKAGYQFLGWYYDSAYTKAVPDKITVTEDTSFYARWKRKATFSLLHYELYGGSLPENTEYDYSEGYEMILPTPSKMGYEFLGWYDNASYTGDSIEKITDHDMGEKYFYAKWRALGVTHSVQYLLDGGHFSGDALTEYVETYSYALPSPIKAGYEFVGWYLEETYATQKETIDSQDNTDLILYAKYSIVDYLISYRLNDGTPVSELPTSYTIETEVVLPQLTKEGSVFIGWFDATGSKFEKTIVGMTGNLSLYAKFIEQGNPSETYVVSYYDINNTLIKQENVTCGGTAIYITCGTDNGLSLCWYQENEPSPYDFSTPVERNIDLYQKWEIAGSVLESIFGNGDLYVDFVAKENYEINGSLLYLSLTLTSGTEETCNPKTGVINPGYSDITIGLCAKMSYETHTTTFNFNVVIKKVVFKSLENRMPVIGYVYTGTGMNITDEAYATLDIINFCFARVTGSYTVSISEIEQSLPKILEARKRGVRVLLCIGGYGSAGINISAAALEESTRKILANSILEIMEKYHLDGVDLDWEYPGFETGQTVQVDRPNYTYLMTEINHTLKSQNSEYLVTGALPGGGSSSRYEVDKITKVMDYLNIMTYDLNSSEAATLHCALYNHGNATPYGSCDTSMMEYVNAGADPKKLIIGAAFYGKKFIVSSYSAVENGLGASLSTTASQAVTVQYTDIVNTYLSNPKIYHRYFDETSMSPYIYGTNRVFICYDDEESIAAKINYVKEKGFGGIMFWDYGSDKTGNLIHAIHENI